MLNQAILFDSINLCNIYFEGNKPTDNEIKILNFDLDLKAASKKAQTNYTSFTFILSLPFSKIP